jgi:hypothetical protein
MRLLTIFAFFVLSLASNATIITIETIFPEGSTLTINNHNVNSGTFDSEASFRIGDDQKVVLISTIFLNGKKTIDGKSFNKTHAKSLGELYEYTSQTTSHRNRKIQLKYSNNKTDFLPEKRIALIIGNAAYSKYANLPSCIDNAIDVSEKLSSLGFDTYTFLNLDTITIRNALKDFFEEVDKGYNVALIYYSGHGIQNDQKQYLVPTNAEFNDSEHLIRQCISLEYINTLMSESKVNEKLVFIDACRNQPHWAKEQPYSAEKEKALMSYTVLASDRDEVAYASKDDNNNSPFTRAFLDVISNPYNNVDDAVREMRRLLQLNDCPNPVIINGGSNFTFYNEIDTSKGINEIRSLALKFRADMEKHNLNNLKTYISEIDSIRLKYNLSYDSFPTECEYALRHFSRILELNGLNFITNSIFNTDDNHYPAIWFDDDSHIATAMPNHNGWIYHKLGFYDNSFKTKEIRVNTLLDDFLPVFFENLGLKNKNHVVYYKDSCIITMDINNGQIVGRPILFPQKWHFNSRSFYNKSQLQLKFCLDDNTKIIISCDSTLYLGNIEEGTINDLYHFDFPINKIAINPLNQNLIAVTSMTDSLFAVYNFKNKKLTKIISLDFAPENIQYSSKGYLLINGISDIKIYNPYLTQYHAIRKPSIISGCAFNQNGNLLSILFSFPKKIELYSFNDYFEYDYSILSPNGHYAICLKGKEYVLYDKKDNKRLNFSINSNTSRVDIFNKKSTHFVYNEFQNKNYKYYIFDIKQEKSFFLLECESNCSIVLTNDASHAIIYNKSDKTINIFDIKRKKYIAQSDLTFNSYVYDDYTNSIIIINNDNFKIYSLDLKLKDIIQLSKEYQIANFTISQNFYYYGNDKGSVYRINKKLLHDKPEFLFSYNKVFDSINVDENDNYISSYIRGEVIDFTNLKLEVPDAKIWNIHSKSLAEDISVMKPSKLLWKKDINNHSIIDLGTRYIQFIPFDNLFNDKARKIIINNK